MAEDDAGHEHGKGGKFVKKGKVKEPAPAEKIRFGPKGQISGPRAFPAAVQAPTPLVSLAPTTPQGVAADVHTIASQAPQQISSTAARGPRFGPQKVFIDHVAGEYMKRHPGTTREQFDAALMDAQQRGLVDLQRADAVEFMHPEDVERSAIHLGWDRSVLPRGSTEFPMASYHFVKVPEKHAESPDEVAAHGRTGDEAERLLAQAQREGVACLADVTRAALRRLLREGGVDAARTAKRLYNDAELKAIADALAATRATAELLGRAQVQAKAERHRGK